MNVIITLIIAIVVVIVLFVAIELFAESMGGDRRLWQVIKGLIVLAALFYVLHRTGVV